MRDSRIVWVTNNNRNGHRNVLHCIYDPCRDDCGTYSHSYCPNRNVCHPNEPPMRTLSFNSCSREQKKPTSSSGSLIASQMVC